MFVFSVHGNETLVPIKGAGFDKLSDYYLLKKDTAPWSLFLS
jgi:hypothetical protein